MPIADESYLLMRALLAGARQKEPAMLDLTRRLVEAESPSDDKAAVDACVAIVAEHARSLGGRVKLHRQRRFGGLLEVHFGGLRRGAGKKAADRLRDRWPKLVLVHVPVGAS